MIAEDAAIHLSDSRTRRISGGPSPNNHDERQFLVGDDEHEEVDDDDDDDRNERDRSRASSRASSFERETRSRRSVMGNAGAQLSRLDVHTTSHTGNGVAYEDGDGMARHSARGTLSAKAGTIMVRSSSLHHWPLTLIVFVLQGIHNIFIVIPQFLVTGLSSIIFAIFEPDKSVLHGHHPGNTKPGGIIPPLNGTEISSARQEAPLERDDGPNSVAIIFR